MDVVVMAVVTMAISKQPVHLGGVMTGAPFLVAQMFSSEGKLVAVRLAGVDIQFKGSSIGIKGHCTDTSIIFH